jgi:hypothetical protein
MAKSNDILFFPFLLDGPRGAPAGFTGMTMATGMADMLRAVYEGVACVHRLDMTNLLTGPRCGKAGRHPLCRRPLAQRGLGTDVLRIASGCRWKSPTAANWGPRGPPCAAPWPRAPLPASADAMKAMVKLEHGASRRMPARGAVHDGKVQALPRRHRFQCAGLQCGASGRQWSHAMRGGTGLDPKIKAKQAKKSEQ